MKRFLPALLILAVALVSGCGSRPQPQPVFEQYMEAIQQGDLDTAKTLVTDDFAESMTPNVEGATEAAVKAWLAKLEVSNVQTEISKDNKNEATVTFDISAPDLGVIVQTVLTEVQQYVQSPQFKKDKGSTEQKQQKLADMASNRLLELIEDPQTAQCNQSGTATLVYEDEENAWKISKVNVDWKWATASNSNANANTSKSN